jgi:death on curing protein
VSLPSSPIWLVLDVVLAAHEAQVSEHGGGTGIRDFDLLESALARPRNAHAYSPELSLPELGAMYGIAIIRNHPFVDGNKRTGLVALELFLDLNGFDLDVDDAAAVRAIVALAAGETVDAAFVAWVVRHARPRPKGSSRT